MTIQSSRRRAFTLIELLVVIAIIGILVGLTLVAVIPMLKKGPELTNKVSNIDQLSTSLTTFKNRFGSYPPSRIRLCRSRSLYGTSNYEVESLAYINKYWPNLPPGWIVNWDGGLDPNSNIWDLEGDQCLIFFLGGIPTGPNSADGFSTNKQNPALPGGERVRFFDFESARLFVRFIDPTLYFNANYPYSSYTTSPAFPFLSYKDVYSTQPYMYFSCGMRANGYQAAHFSASLNIGPYYESAQKFVFPDSFQVISAGVDTLFGGGGQWSTIGAEYSNRETQDNQSNFHPNKLGVSTN